MKKRLAGLLAACVLLSGCNSIMDGYYYSAKPHQEYGTQIQSGNASAANDYQLRQVMEDLVESGIENAVINVADYDQTRVEDGMAAAVRHIHEGFPVGAYAVDVVEYEIGLSGGAPAISVAISYIHGRSEIRKIKNVSDMEEAVRAISGTLNNCDDGVVLLVEAYEEMDLAQLVADYAEQNPDMVMETPQVAVGIYPESGTTRVVELSFTYQTSREALRQMQSQVQPVFDAATLYVSGDGSDLQKYYQLFAFLMERYDYTIETSITPAYSLLRHGVGDSKAFALVYSSMCRQAGLECMVVNGTREGEPRYWNIVCDNDYYYHVDLLRSSAAGQFREMTDVEMVGYVWDYSAYPECVGVYIPPTEPEVTEPATEQTEVPTELPTQP